MSELAAILSTVYGRVQGVYFRAFVEDHALLLKLTGYVKNLSDRGRLEVYAEGEKANLEQLLVELNTGPPRAKVERVDVEWLPYSGHFNRFEVRH